MFSNDLSDEISVCLIEDDEADFILFKEYLDEIPFPKYKLTRFKDAPSVLAGLKTDPSEYKIYVIDHFLGSQTGLEILHEIRTIAGTISAVLISGISKEEMETIAKETGFQGYLEKKNLSAFTLSKTFFSVLKESEESTENRSDTFLLRMEAISQFSGGIAHDFNNILNIIIANLDMLEMQCKDQPDVLNRIRSAQNAVMRGADVNKKLLNFSRKQSLQPETVDPNRLIADYLEKSKEIFPENVQVIFEPGSEGDLCRIDRGEFANCLMNLFQNAKEALEESEGKILIETDTIVLNFKDKSLGLKEGNYFLLRVADNGKGMDANLFDKIFEPFFTTKQKGKNSGLGLPMIFGFVKRSGGRIVFDSHPGVGSDFYIYLPVEQLKSNPHFVTVKSSEKPKEIFYFSDEGESSKRTSYIFRRLGYRVFSFKDLNVFESYLSKVGSETVLLSETWKEDFSKWNEIVMNAQKSGLKARTCYFFSSIDVYESENSVSIPWPISRKSLENHFGIL
ncbi:hybrid sensor histidine kinase/response regulator [Leptospira alstonii]|uniref:histidine kinase n=2 Tax=Leptospira alstonii TaxID=28452 RepID=M6D901_9LEPT|nr:hybrid sensor histidine kinase/response regulator [Leptospira alstonii]EMJ95035.1 GHKL domain protein [Leptospira alstonii serovar Sichuan str. 79601]EQA80225.1 GHKL domain protein [Leptospira alstonii serovar Pingchang str. 80-412]